MLSMPVCRQCCHSFSSCRHIVSLASCVVTFSEIRSYCEGKGTAKVERETGEDMQT